MAAVGRTHLIRVRLRPLQWNRNKLGGKDGFKRPLVLTELRGYIDSSIIIFGDFHTLFSVVDRSLDKR